MGLVWDEGWVEEEVDVWVEERNDVVGCVGFGVVVCEEVFWVVL